MTTDTTTTAPPTSAKKRWRAKKDPNRVPVKRERSEMYVLVGKLETAKRERVAIVKRIEAAAGLQAKLRDLDATIAAHGERLRMLSGTTDDNQARRTTAAE